MDFSKSIYIKKNDNLDGRTIIIFDCNYFRLTKENISPVMSHILKIFTESIIQSKIQCGVEEFCVIVNLKNIKKCKLTVRFLVYMTKILKTTFPDMLYKCLLNNPSVVFRSLYLVVRRLIDKKTRTKIEFIKDGVSVPYETVYNSYD